MDEALISDRNMVFLIRPRLGGFANDVTIELEHGDILYHVRSKPLALTGRQYTVLDKNMHEILRSEQDHTAIFPRHTIYENNVAVGKVGQAGIIPQNYFMQIRSSFYAELKLGSFDPIFKLSSEGKLIAEIAQHRSIWIVVISIDQERFLILNSIAIIYRENTIGG